MNNTAAIHRGIVQAIRWLAPAWCLLCRRQHNTACAICADCEAAFSRNRHACHRCALPLETTHSSEVNRLAFAQLSAQTLCPTCIRHSPAVVSARAPYLMRTGIRDLIHLWKFQNRPQLSSFVADLLVNDLPQAAKDLGAPDSTASQRVLVPIPTQWRRQVSRGFDHTWLLAQAIRTRHAEPMVVRSWFRNQRFRPP